MPWQVCCLSVCHTVTRLYIIGRYQYNWLTGQSSEIKLNLALTVRVKAYNLWNTATTKIAYNYFYSSVAPGVTPTGTSYYTGIWSYTAHLYVCRLHVCAYCLHMATADAVRYHFSKPLRYGSRCRRYIAWNLERLSSSHQRYRQTEISQKHDESWLDLV